MREMTRDEAEARMNAAEAEALGCTLAARTRIRSQAAEVGQLRSERDKLRAEVERLRGVVAKARGHIEVMRECAEASLEHLEGLHRVPAARGVRQADRALAELEGKGHKHRYPAVNGQGFPVNQCLDCGGWR